MQSDNMGFYNISFPPRTRDSDQSLMGGPWFVTPYLSPSYRHPFPQDL